MTNRLYDYEASRRRVQKAEREVVAQQIYIAKETDPELLSKATLRLSVLQNILEIAKKTHFLIESVIFQREEDEIEAFNYGINKQFPL